MEQFSRSVYQSADKPQSGADGKSHRNSSELSVINNHKQEKLLQEGLEFIYPENDPPTDDSMSNLDFGIVYTKKACKDSENKNSVEQQKTECTNWAKSNGIIILKVFNDDDDGVGGRDFDREGFTQAMDLIKQLNSNGDPIVSHFICSDATRFSKGNSSENFKKIQELKNYGVKIKFLSDATNYNLDSSEVLREGLKNEFLKYQKAYLKQNSERGKKTILMRGGRPFTVPIGYYRSSSNTIEVDEERAPLIKDVLTLYAEGLLQTRSEIWLYLLRKGFPNTRGLPTTYNTVERMFKDTTLRFYCGRIFHPTQGIKSPVKAKHEAIIDKETLDKILSRKNRCAETLPLE